MDDGWLQADHVRLVYRNFTDDGSYATSTQEGHG